MKWLGKLKGVFGSQQPSSRRCKSFKPSLEVLEERCVPAGLNLFWDPGGADHNWNTASNWHINSDMGAPAAAAPGTADDITFDNLQNCTLNVDATVDKINIPTTNGGTLSMNGHNLTETGGTGTTGFSFNAGIIDFGTLGGTLTIKGASSDVWGGTASFLSTNGSGHVLLEGSDTVDEKLTVLDTGVKRMECVFIIGVETDRGIASLRCLGAGEIALGGNGNIQITSRCTLALDSGSTFHISSTQVSGTNSGDILDSGIITVGPTAGGAYTVDIAIDIRNSGQLTLSNNATLNVNNYYNTAQAAITQIGTSTNVTVATGTDLNVYDGGYSQTSGDFWVVKAGTQTAFSSEGIYVFYGNVYINQTNANSDVSWLGQTTTGISRMEFRGDLYIHIGLGTGKTTDFIEANSIILAGNLHVINNGTFGMNDTISPLYGVNSMTGAFVNLYDGWAGTTALAFTPTITADHHFQLKKN